MMRSAGSRVFVGVTVVALAGSSQSSFAGEVFVVDDDGKATVVSCDAESEAFLSVGSAMAFAEDGATLLVCPGIYVENVDFAGKSVYLRSTHGPRMTILDGGDRGSVVTFTSGEGAEAVLEGFTLSNGRAMQAQMYEGGGIRIRHASPLIRRNIITANRSCFGGTGIAIRGGSATIEENWIVSNGLFPGCTSGHGGGVRIEDSSRVVLRRNVIANNVLSGGDGGGIALNNALSTLIEGNVVAGNDAGRSIPCARGGGISIVNQASGVTIAGNLIVKNKAGCGGGIHWIVPSGAGLVVVNNTIAENDGETGSAIYAEWKDGEAQFVNNTMAAASGQLPVFCGDFNDPNPPQFRYNNVWGDGGALYGGICADVTGHDGNISVDPQFIDPLHGDYRSPLSAGLTDAGTNSVQGLPAADLHGNPRINDGDGDGDAVVDIGAFELPFRVVVDVRPFSRWNVVNPESNGWLLVAILSVEPFDATSIDRSTVVFGPSRARAASSWNLDVNRDGRRDILLLFRTRETGIACGAESVTLVGDTVFSQRVEGSDVVRTIGCHSSD